MVHTTIAIKLAYLKHRRLAESVNDVLLKIEAIQRQLFTNPSSINDTLPGIPPYDLNLDKTVKLLSNPRNISKEGLCDTENGQREGWQLPRRAA